MFSKPIKVEIYGTSSLRSEEICAKILDTNQWRRFRGYGLLPGIKSAIYDVRFPNILHSVIRVYNTDGSMHTVEIIEWDPQRRIALLFQDFTSIVKNFATHFIEIWEFQIIDGVTHIKRSLTMYPSGPLGRLFLLPISVMMKKALEKNLRDITSLPKQTS